MIIKKSFFIVTSNNTPKTMTRQGNHHEKDREKCIEKGERYCE